MDWKARLKTAGIYTVATGGFIGYFPVAPGTAGTFLGLGAVWILRDAPFWVLLIFSLILLVIGAWASGEACQLLGKPDSGHIVIDEIVGMMITMIGIPVTGYWMFWGFLLFRFFDVVKLPPGNYFDEKVKNGWGVVMDDVTAGVYSNIILQLMLRAQI